MSASSAEPARARATLEGAHRLWVFSSLSRHSLKTGGLARAGRTYSWGIALTHAVVVVWMSRDTPEGAAGIVTAALGPLSWSAGLVAWAAARDLDAEERTNGLSALASARGATLVEQRIARTLATIRVVASTIGSPAALLALLAMVTAPSVRIAVARTPLLGGVLAYALVFGVVLGALSRAASEISGRYGRTVFAVIVLGPLALGDAAFGVPSVVGALSWLVERLSALLGAG